MAKYHITTDSGTYEVETEESAPQRPYTPDEVKQHFANYAPAQGNTDPSNWGIAKEALKGAGKFLLDPGGTTHGTGLQQTGVDEKGEPMWGIGGPSTGPLAPTGAGQEFGATMAAAPSVGEGAVGLGKAAVKAGRTAYDVIKDPSVLRRVTKAALPHGKEFVEAGEDVARAAGESKSRTLAAEHRAGPQPVPSWRGNPTPVITPPPEVQPISGPLPSGRQPGPAPPGPEFPNRQIPAWANMPTPTPTSVPKVQSIPSTLPSGRQVGPAPPAPEMQGRAIPAWANLPEPVSQSIPVTEPQPPAQLPSGRSPGGIGNMKPVKPAPVTPTGINGKPDAQAAAEALKNEMGGTPGEPMVIPSTEPVVTKTQGEAIGRMKKVQALMEQLRKNGVTPQSYKSLTSQERASVERMIQERTGDSAAAKAQILSALRGEDIPKFAKGGIVAPIPTRQSKPGRTSSRGIWYGPPGSRPGMSRHA